MRPFKAKQVFVNLPCMSRIKAGFKWESIQLERFLPYNVKYGFDAMIETFVVTREHVLWNLHIPLKRKGLA